MMRSNFVKKMVAVISTAMLMGTALATPVSAATTVSEYKVDSDSNVMITQEQINKAVAFAKGYVGKSTIYAKGRNGWYDFNSYHNCAQFVRSAFYTDTGLPYLPSKNPTYWAREDVWGIVSTSMDNIPVGAVVLWGGWVGDSYCGHIALVTDHNEYGQAICVGAGAGVVEEMLVADYGNDMTYLGWSTFGGYDMRIKPLPTPKLSIKDKWITQEASVSCTDATQLDVVLINDRTLKAKSYTIRGSSGKLTIPDGPWTIKVRGSVYGEYTEFTTRKAW